jgi:nucleoside-diphosphate-sugar epimerase
MNRYLITGGSGFVGRAFRKWILQNDPESFIVNIDIKNGTDCRDWFKTDKTKYDYVIHLAAIVGGRTMIEGNPIAVATDLSIDSEMFNWAVRTKQKRIVYFSSSAAYPIELQDAPYKLHESDLDLHAIRNPDMSYGWSKLSGEMLADYARKAGINVHVFRPFSGYGEDQDLDYPFPSFIERAKKIRNNELKKFDIWGNGLQVRDFIHIDDVVEAVMKAVELDIQTPINLGTGRPTNFIELAKICMDMAGTTVKIKTDETKPMGVFYRCADNSKMLEFYQPKIGLEEGVLRALKYEAK